MKPRILICVLLLVVCIGSFGQFDYSFYAVYDRVLDSRNNSFKVELFDFSGDGNTIVVAGEDNLYKNVVLYTLNSDGSNLQHIQLPEEVSSIRSVTIDSAGSVVYFHSDPWIYKFEVDSDTVTGIFNIREEVGQVSPNRIMVSGNGEYVFFRIDGGYDTGTIMRINSDGSEKDTVVYYKELIRDGGYAGGLQQYYSVCHDGSRIAFIMSGYHGTGGFGYKHELFLKDEEGYHQVTNEGVVTKKYHAFISGDGSTIIFSQSSDEKKWFSIGADGTGRSPIADYGFNFPGLDVTYDGSMMIHGEGSGKGGCLVSTDGSDEREIFPSGFLLFNHWWTEIRLSDDGSKVCFMYDGDDDGVRTFSLNVGHFGNPFAVSDAPLIEQIQVTPSVIPDVPDARVLLNTKISDPQGTGDIKGLVCNELVEARKTSSSYVPVYFRWDPNDQGSEPDLTADDGIFSSEGTTRDIVDQFSEAGIRIGVMDNSWTVVVADTVFEIGELAASGKVSLLLPAESETDLDTAINLVWEKVFNAVYYQVQVGLDSLFGNPVLDRDEHLDTLLSISGLSFETRYSWRVRAHNGVEYGEWSEISTFTTKKAGVIEGMASLESDPILPVIRPNPVYMGEEVFLAIPGTLLYSLSVFDTRGTCIYRSSRGMAVENLAVQIVGPRFSRGVYIYRLDTTAGTEIGRFMVL